MGSSSSTSTDATQAKQTPASDEIAYDQYKVLIVEDSIELAEVIQATLERMGMKVSHESHGSKAIKLFETLKPDIMLLDIGLPDIPGWKLLDKLRAITQEKEGQTLPKVIIISAYGDPANRLMGKLQDVNRYLIKPFTPDEVEEVVKKAILSTDEEETPSIGTGKPTVTTEKKPEEKPETAPTDKPGTNNAEGTVKKDKSPDQKQ